MAETARLQPTFDAPLIQRPPPAPARTAAAAPQPTTTPRVFVADGTTADAGESASPALGRLAELVAHRGTEGPFTVALTGGPGSGKSRALAQVLDDAAALSRGAAGGANSPFVTQLIPVRLDAAEIGEDLGAALSERIHAAVSRAAPEIATEAVDEANHSAIDPHARLQSLSDSLDLSRRRLDGERRSRDEAESRRARLTETILYETAGTRVDAYARANRGAIESVLTAFGFKGEPLATYKGLVQSLCDAGSPTARVVASLKSLWAYPGQTKRIVWAVVFIALAWGFGTLGRDQGWLDGLNDKGDTLRGFADAIRAHASWFGIARELCWAVALLCLASCIWRAVRFSRPILRGAALVDADLAVRRGELDNLVAHHAQRVDVLSGETDGLARRVMEAERRAGGAQPATPVFLTGSERDGADRARRSYIDHVGRLLSRKGSSRVVVALDDLDTLRPETALAALARAGALIRSPAFGLVAALDTQRLVSALGPEAHTTLERLVQVPFNVGGDDAAGWADIISGLSSPRADRVSRTPDATRSVLDGPIDGTEQAMLAAFAPLAGPAPRGVKRFVNLYRLGRQDAADDLAAFALTLALAIGGTPDEKAAFDASLRHADGNAALRSDSGRLAAAIERASSVAGRPITVGDARRAQALAARWSLPG